MSEQEIEDILLSPTQQEKQNPLLHLIQQLSPAVVYTESTNFDTNKKLWNNYAREWTENVPWVLSMKNNLPNNDQSLSLIGDEWSDTQHLEQVLQEFLFPFIHGEAVVGEIGSGGGRIAIRVSPLVKQLHCFDIAEEMLKKANSSLSPSCPNTYFHLLDGNHLAPSFHLSFDALYAFDVFPHLDLHSIWQWLQSISSCLKPNGHCFISTANLKAPGGWQRFEKQKKYTAGGFYFICPEIVETMVSHLDLVMVKKSIPSPDNMYYNRDFLCVLQKKGEKDLT